MNKSLTILAIFLFGYGFAQQDYATTIVNTSPKEVTNPTDWVVYLDNEEFTIEYEFVDCDPAVGYDFQQVHFKFTNKTNSQLSIGWHIGQYYNSVCRTCDYPVEYDRSIVLSPNETLVDPGVNNVAFGSNLSNVKLGFVPHLIIGIPSLKSIGRVLSVLISFENPLRTLINLNSAVSPEVNS